MEPLQRKDEPLSMKKALQSELVMQAAFGRRGSKAIRRLDSESARPARGAMHWEFLRMEMMRRGILNEDLERLVVRTKTDMLQR